MSETTPTIETLKAFSPLDSLKRANLNALANKTSVSQLPEGQKLFKAGDKDKRTFYLVSGQIELIDDNGQSRQIKSGSDDARQPLAPMLPRKYTARAVTDIEFISIDTDLLDVMLTWDHTGQYEVSELKDSETMNGADWMTSLLRTSAFHRIPPANIQAIFMRMQQVNYNAGDRVIKQGDDGDFFYVITKGTCEVTRETPLSEDGIKLAELKEGDTFGEEALISGAKRNATVSMLTDGCLMRLGKDDFNKFMNEPMVNWVDYSEAKKLISDGAVWLDVRLPSEFEAYHEEGAINIPLYFIRLKAGTLDPEQTYVLCCDTGRRSSAGTFILNERGFNTRVLRGGLNTNKGPQTDN
ncbi:MAG: cyclic nucleotide-binding domain-containing protein [Gammaproteobacteria bacterium]|nr:cyclic nucleotide-binding domain-containing protein [Gammaproteobacteria bacterium]